MVLVTPFVIDGVLYQPNQPDTPGLTVGSPGWWTWLELATTRSFTFRGTQGHFTARKDQRQRGSGYWIAYRRMSGVLRNQYLGVARRLTLDRLDAAAANLAALATTPESQSASQLNVLAAPKHPSRLALLPRTKIAVPPPRTDLVARPRLFEQLNAGLRYTLTLVVAPAGFGKTTLLSSWVYTTDRAVIWLSLDAGERDPFSFIRVLVMALQTIMPSVGAMTLALLHMPQTPPIQNLLASLINDLVGRDGRSTFPACILILDDYHTVDVPAVQTILMFLLEHLPSTFHLIIASRVVPQLPLGRIRGHSRLNELTISDLQFNSVETSQFLTEIMCLNLAKEDLIAIEERTEGWAVGLQLAALVLQNGQASWSTIETFGGSHRAVVDYLTEEVLAFQPPNVRSFLMQTSILDSFCAELCAAIVLPADPADQLTLTAQAMVEYIERAHLFLLPLDDNRRWYRYHHLFAEALRYQLRREQPEVIDDLHRRAAEWYAQQGRPTEAIHHLVAGHNLDQAATLIARHGLQFICVREDVPTVQNWLKLMPEPFIYSRADLCLIQGWISSRVGPIDSIARWAELAAVANAGHHELQSEIVALRAIAATLSGDSVGAVALARDALEGMPTATILQRAELHYMCGLNYRREGQVTEAIAALYEALALSRLINSRSQILDALNALASVQILGGRLQDATQTYHEAVRLASADLGQPASTSRVYAGWAWLLCERNDQGAAERAVYQSIELAQQMADPGTLLNSYACLMHIRQAQGDRAGVQAALVQVRDLWQRYSGGSLQQLESRAMAHLARLWLQLGDLSAASHWARQYVGSMVPATLSRHEFEDITLARVWLAENRRDEARMLLEQLRIHAAAAGRTGSEIEIVILQALAYYADDEETSALEALGTALRYAAPEGYMRRFLDEGRPMAKLLKQMLSYQDTSAYVRRLLAAFGAEMEAVHKDIAVGLSFRERQVLHLLATGCSNAEIATQLVVTVDTVKKHITRIFAKLGVQSRAQAIAWIHTHGSPPPRSP